MRTNTPRSIRLWLSSPVRPTPVAVRVTRACTVEGCETWVFGSTKVEVADRLADHREREHRERAHR